MSNAFKYVVITMQVEPRHGFCFQSTEKYVHFAGQHETGSWYGSVNVQAFLCTLRVILMEELPWACRGKLRLTFDQYMERIQHLKRSSHDFRMLQRASSKQ